MGYLIVRIDLHIRGIGHFIVCKNLYNINTTIGYNFITHFNTVLTKKKSIKKENLITHSHNYDCTYLTRIRSYVENTYLYFLMLRSNNSKDQLKPGSPIYQISTSADLLGQRCLSSRQFVPDDAVEQTKCLMLVSD